LSYSPPGNELCANSLLSIASGPEKTGRNQAKTMPAWWIDPDRYLVNNKYKNKPTGKRKLKKKAAQ
jgi:hypothetical protein